jgi:hypothetical protein
MFVSTMIMQKLSVSPMIMHKIMDMPVSPMIMEKNRVTYDHEKIRVTYTRGN